ncbi:iron-containing alcohol dehydrogenase [uncultured Serinicoccus sp.]|uniref:iron-containing alcohol dehydrogenase n=1 Tax=uncultured Serinicoccus sp. TaxID=735514 RepID=UPI00260CCFD4|nr:iron-containing alcohol dehydrogenase [uncultured Serinicoccus sp.]
MTPVRYLNRLEELLDSLEHWALVVHRNLEVPEPLLMRAAWVQTVSSSDKNIATALALRERIAKTGVHSVVVIGPGAIMDLARFAYSASSADVLRAFSKETRATYEDIERDPLPGDLILCPSAVSGAESGRVAVVKKSGSERLFVKVPEGSIVYIEDVLKQTPSRVFRMSIENCLSKAYDAYVLTRGDERSMEALVAAVELERSQFESRPSRLHQAQLAARVQDGGGIGIIHATCHLVRFKLDVQQGEVHKILRRPVFDWACERRHLSAPPFLSVSGSPPHGTNIVPACSPESSVVTGGELKEWYESDVLCDLSWMDWNIIDLRGLAALVRRAMESTR